MCGNQIRALILENTFTSIPRLIPTAMPILSPFSFLCHQKWDSASKVHLIPPNVATLLLSGTSDEIIPSSHMEELEKLFRQTPGSEKREGKLVEFRAGRHSKFFGIRHSFLLTDSPSSFSRWYVYSAWILATCGGLYRELGLITFHRTTNSANTFFISHHHSPARLYTSLLSIACTNYLFE